MIFHAIPIPGAYRVEPERHRDDRGSFARLWCAREFAAKGLRPELVQASLSSSLRRGTLRGMHYSVAPHPETKLVRCTRGAIYDVIVDLRPDSPTYRHWYAEELSGENAFALYVPEGIAHGFLTLRNDSDVLYQMDEFFYPECARGVRYDDPAFNVVWPEAVCVISERDRAYPDFLPPGPTGPGAFPGRGAA